MIFTVYSKDGCPYCSKVQKMLSLAEQKFVTYRLGVDYQRDEFYEKFGQGSTFPQVVLNDETNIGGCSETVKFLKENNLV